MSAPMPRLAPVTTTTLPSSRPMRSSGPLFSTAGAPGQPVRGAPAARRLGRGRGRAEAEPLAREDAVGALEAVPARELRGRDAVLAGDAPDRVPRLHDVHAA